MRSYLEQAANAALQVSAILQTAHASHDYKALQSKAIVGVPAREKLGQITWEKLSESNTFTHIASVKRPQDAWSDFFWKDQHSQKVD